MSDAHISIYLLIYACVCVCVCVRVYMCTRVYMCSDPCQTLRYGVATISRLLKIIGLFSSI